MKFLYFFVFLFVLGSIFTIQIRKDKNSKSIPVKEAKFLSMQCMHQNDFIDCVGNLAGQAQIKLNVLEDEKFANEHLIDMNKRVEIIKKFLKKECLNNGINESQYNKILQKLDEKVYTIDTANIKDDIVLLKINSNVAFTAITDEIYIWGKLIKEHDGEKLKEKIPFSLFHEAIHVVIGKKGGILPQFQ